MKVRLNYLFKLKHDIRVSSKVDIAREEIRSIFRTYSQGLFDVDDIVSLPLLIRQKPFIFLPGETLHRMCRLSYLGRIQGFLVSTFIGNAVPLDILANRLTYVREFYVILETRRHDLEESLSSILMNLFSGNIIPSSKVEYLLSKVRSSRSPDPFVDLLENVQVSLAFHDDEVLITLIVIPIQTLLEFTSEVLKLPNVTFTRQFEGSPSLFIEAKEKGVLQGLKDLLNHLKHEFHRQPWLGLWKEHIGDYVDWAFSDFRTWWLHFIHKYLGKADPWLARSVINLLEVKGGATILDPFCGSGTFITDAPLFGLNAIGFEINPLAALIARVKTNWNYDLEKLREKVIELLGILANNQSVSEIILSPQVFVRWISTVKASYSDIRRFQSRSLITRFFLGLKKYFIDKISDSAIRDFFLVIASRSIIKSISTGRIVRLESVVKAMGEDVLNHYLYIFATYEMLNRLGFEKINGSSKIILGDSRNLSSVIGDEEIDGVLSSPPYFDALDYVGFSKHPILILGLDTDIDHIYAQTIGARKTKRKVFGIEKLPLSARNLVLEFLRTNRRSKMKIIYNYLMDMQHVLRELYNALKPNSKLIFVVAKYHTWKFKDDTTWEINGAQILIDLARSVGFSFEREILHDLSKIDIGKIRKESVIILRKKNQEFFR